MLYLVNFPLPFVNNIFRDSAGFRPLFTLPTPIQAPPQLPPPRRRITSVEEKAKSISGEGIHCRVLRSACIFVAGNRPPSLQPSFPSRMWEFRQNRLLMEAIEGTEGDGGGESLQFISSLTFPVY